MTLSVELTGLQAAQTDLDTIGNNIANVGTDGFKSSTPNFSSLYGASLAGATGGAVPGQGVQTSSLSQLFTEGTISQSGNPLDIAINGNGFLQVQTPTGLAYTRDGALQLDANGIVTNRGCGARLLTGGERQQRYRDRSDRADPDQSGEPDADRDLEPDDGRQFAVDRPADRHDHNAVQHQ
jgi:flagellar hook-basal body protein